MTNRQLDALDLDLNIDNPRILGENLFADAQFQLGRRAFRDGLPLSTLYGQLAQWGWLDSEYSTRERGPRCP